VDEFQIIRRYFERNVSDKAIVVGIGDDAAVLRPSSDRDLLTVVDTLVAGVHFPENFAAEDIGFRCVAVNLSDIAAMGGRPRWMTLALTMTDSNAAWLDGFARGLFLAADAHNVALVGGDTTSGKETAISIQIIGDVEPDKFLTRSAASANEGIYVTGTIGDASAGLAFLQSGVAINDDARFLVDRFSRPKARVAVGQALATHASAAIDLSDGLFTDIEKLLFASGVAGSFELDYIPVSEQLTSLMEPDDALRFALGGGDDYELCFTSKAPEADLQRIAAEHGVAITKIGETEDGSGLRCTRSGTNYDYHHDGYRHFR
jgi:thiamine-monophosphate kinase